MPQSSFQETERERELENRMVEINGLVARSHIPKRHADLIDENPDLINGGSGPWSLTRDRLFTHVGTGALLVIHGRRGVGKTMLGALVCRHSCGLLRSALFTSATELFLDIRSSFDGSRSEKEATDRYCNRRAPRMLVIDELHERGASEWENQRLAYIVNRRYEHRFDTVFLTNHDASGAMESLGSSIVDRIRECGEFVECSWSSYRSEEGRRANAKAAAEFCGQPGSLPFPGSRSA